MLFYYLLEIIYKAYLIILLYSLETLIKYKKGDKNEGSIEKSQKRVKALLF